MHDSTGFCEILLLDLLPNPLLRRLPYELDERWRAFQRSIGANQAIALARRQRLLLFLRALGKVGLELSDLIPAQTQIDELSAMISQRRRVVQEASTQHRQ